jgi:hypothetical protein
MLTRAAIRSAAESFWAAAGGRELYGRPVKIDRAVVRTLSVAIHHIPALTTEDIASILGRVNASIPLDEVARPLRGCLVADAGVGFILVDSDDPEDEQRLTIAHEVAHFLLHYIALRNAALAGLGHHLIAVLDRTRSPTKAELLSSALRDLPLGPFRHAMVRNGSRPRGVVATMEAEADDLAIELLAPWRLVRSLESQKAEAIAGHFGIPLTIAARLASMAASSTTELGVTSLFGMR